MFRAAQSRPTYGLAAGLAIGLGVLGVTVSIALPILFPIFRFPQPTGPYGIGTMTYHWIDVERRELFSTDPNVHRELMVQIWYPAQANSSASHVPYLPHPEVLASTAHLMHVPPFIFGHLKYALTLALPSAPVASGEARYPVLVFLSGRGGYRQSNTFQVEELVSHGYIVAAIDQPYAASGVIFPDGRLVPMDPRMFDPARPGHPTFYDRMIRGYAGVIPYLAQDVVFALDRLAALNLADPNRQLTGRLDLQHEGIFAVSLGGIVASEACLREPRLRACLLMDAYMPADVVNAGLHQPIMWLSRGAESMKLEGWAQADINETQDTMRAVFERLQGAGYIVRIRGMFHPNFSDAPLFSPLASWIGLTGPIDGARGQSTVNAYSLAFFDRHLNGRQEALLEGPTEQYSEVILETRWR